MTNYQTGVEVATGDSLDGLPIYRKSIAFASGPNPGLAGQAIVPHGVPALAAVVSIGGVLRVPRTDGKHDLRPLPYTVANAAYAGNGIEASLYDDHVSLFSAAGSWGGKPGEVVLTYTRGDPDSVPGVAYQTGVAALTGDSFNGNTVYRKRLLFGSGPAAPNTTLVAHGEDIRDLLSLRGVLLDPSNQPFRARPLPLVDSAAPGYGIEVSLFDQWVALFTNSGSFGSCYGYLDLEFTRQS